MKVECSLCGQQFEDDDVLGKNRHEQWHNKEDYHKHVSKNKTWGDVQWNTIGQYGSMYEALGDNFGDPEKDMDNPDFNRHITIKFLMKVYGMSEEEATKVYEEGYDELNPTIFSFEVGGVPAESLSDVELLNDREMLYGTYRHLAYLRELEAEIIRRGLGNPNYKEDYRREEEGATEDLSAFLDPAPIASIATMVGQNVKDPLLGAIRKKIHHEVSGRDWTHMTQEQRRVELIEKAIDIGDQDLYLVAGKDWADLLPATKWKLENSTDNEYEVIEAEIYKKLST